ncbi:MAG TPA: cation-translocating P-type ATPase [Bacteroidota bacterium]|nr:cation-translocating P-type ATPase [Bacteroidota bacterium]
MMSPAPSDALCDQCGLPLPPKVVTLTEEQRPLHFCCYGCSMTYALIGHGGEEGAVGLFLARLGFGAFLSMNIMGLSWALYDPQWFALGIDEHVFPLLEKLLFVLAVPVMVFVGYPFAKNAWREAKEFRLSIDALIALGSFAAFGFSTYQIFSGGRGVYFDTATMTLVLVTAGRYLEANAKLRTSNAIKQLLELQPQTARIVADGKEQIVSAETVPCDAIIKVLPGERIPLDAILVDGTTSVNEAVLTGESVPVAKQVGDRVYAATVNVEGVFTAKVAARLDETAYARVIRLVEAAQRSRSGIQRYVDTLSARFIPAVIAIAALTFIGWLVVASADVAALHALTVLVVACPCALGIGAPLATTIALGRAAEHGIFVRSTDLLEKLSATQVVVFDKTGTLTTGAFEVVHVRANGQEEEFLSVVASLEQNSEHPLAKAVVEYARAHAVSLRETRNVSAIPGQGITGEVRMNGAWKKVVVGTRNLFPQGALSEAESPSNTTVYAGWDGRIQGLVELRDTLRQQAADTVRELHRDGIQTVLLSGDTEEATKRVAEEVSIPRYYGRQMPADKVARVHELKSTSTVVMVGDGINDAPSLAAADVGITLGSATDIAKESADVTIVGNHLEKIPVLIRYARRTLGTIRWNLFWAFTYNAVGIALAVVGLLQPIVAALAMIGSSLFIIMNSRRLAHGTFLSEEATP